AKETFPLNTTVPAISLPIDVEAMFESTTAFAAIAALAYVTAFAAMFAAITAAFARYVLVMLALARTICLAIFVSAPETAISHGVPFPPMMGAVAANDVT